MEAIDRRSFQRQTMGSLVTWSLLNTLFANDSFSQDVKPIASQWLAQIHSMSLDLKGKKLEQLVWQDKVEQLLEKVDLPELLRFIDFEKLVKHVKPAERGEVSLKPILPKVEGLPTELVFGLQVFSLTKDRSVVPHGHDNMATAFLMLQGTCHGKHYDRLEDESKHIIIKPTIDRSFGPGEHSSVTDSKDNVHWFKATSDHAYIFNLHVMNVKPGKTGRVYIDPDGEKISEGRIRARKIDHKEANQLYG